MKQKSSVFKQKRQSPVPCLRAGAENRPLSWTPAPLSPTAHRWWLPLTQDSPVSSAILFNHTNSHSAASLLNRFSSSAPQQRLSLQSQGQNPSRAHTVYLHSPTQLTRVCVHTNTMSAQQSDFPNKFSHVIAWNRSAQS